MQGRRFAGFYYGWHSFYGQLEKAQLLPHYQCYMDTYAALQASCRLLLVTCLTAWPARRVELNVSQAWLPDIVCC